MVDGPLDFPICLDKLFIKKQIPCEQYIMNNKSPQIKNKFSDSALSIKTGLTALINFQRAQIIVNDKKYSISPIGKAAQELVLTSGLENWVKERI